MSVLDEMASALTDNNYPVENCMSLGAVEMFKATQDAFWIKVWLELNAERYTGGRSFALDLMEVFEL